MTSPKPSILAAVSGAFIALPAATALLFLAPGASAQTRARPASTAIEILRVNPAGDTLLRGQIETAARKVCAAVAIHSPLLPREQADCVHATISETIRKLDGVGIVTAAR
jgi:UrcA family protein